MSIILVLTGPHGVGKTTLGRAVAGVLGWTWQEELGYRMRLQALERDPGAGPALPQEEFDRRLFRAELKRDAASLTLGARVVETWHPGNMAYARMRSPALARQMEIPVRRALRTLGPVLVQPLEASPETLRQRCSEPGDPDELIPFFLRVASLAVQVATSWDLLVLPPVCTDASGVDACSAQVVRAVRGGMGATTRGGGGLALAAIAHGEP